MLAQQTEGPELDPMAPVCNSSLWETGAERLLIVQGQVGLQNEALSGREGEEEDTVSDCSEAAVAGE